MTRRAVVILSAIVGVMVAASIAAFAFFSASGDASQFVSSGTLGAPTGANASSPSSTSISANVTVGPTTPPASGYVVFAHGDTSTVKCSISTATGSCTVGSLTPSTSYSFDIYSRLGTHWISAATKTISGTTIPDAPSDVTLVNGGGAGSAYINRGNRSSVSVDVTMPSTAKAADTVHLTASDGTSTVTATTQSSITGGGLVHFTGLDLSALNDGSITFTAWASNAGGDSLNHMLVSLKDTVAPTIAAANIARAGTSPTNASSLSWTATFSEPVNNVIGADFGFVTGAGITGTPTVSSATAGSAPAAAWSVAASTSGVTGGNGPSDNTIALKLTSAGTIADAAGNALGTTPPVTGDAYVYDTTAPVVTLTKVNGSTATFPVFTKNNITSVGGACGTANGDDATVSVTLNGSPSSPASTSCSGSNWTLTFTTPISVENTYSIVASQTDAAGNTGSDTKSVTVDKTGPIVSSISRTVGAANPTNTGPLSWTVTFNEPVSGVTTSNFSLATSNTGGSAPALGTATAVGGAPSATWTVTATTVGTTGTNAGSIGLNLANNTNVVDRATNALTTATFAGEAFTFDTAKPSGSAISINQTNQTADSGDTVVFTYNEKMAPSSIASGWDGTSLNVTVHAINGGSGNDSLTVFDGSNTTQLNLGAVGLGAKGYFTGDTTFTATMVMNAAGTTVTVTLGTPANSSVVQTAGNGDKGPLSWTPSAGARDVAGNTANTTAVTGGISSSQWF